MSVVPGDRLEFADLPGRRAADPLRGLGARSSLRIVRMVREEGRRAHRHPSSEEVVYVVDGRGSSWIDGEWREVGPGDVIHIPAGAPHATVPDPGEEMWLVCFFPHPDLPGNTEETDIEVLETKEEEG